MTVFELFFQFCQTHLFFRIIFWFTKILVLWLKGPNALYLQSLLPMEHCHTSKNIFSAYFCKLLQYNFIPWLWLILLLCDYMILFMLIWQFNFDSFFEVVLFTLFPWYVWIAFYLMMINFIWYVCNCAVWVTSSLISLDDWIIFWRVWMLSWIVGLSVAFNFT